MTRLLLDTHALLWAASEPHKLGLDAKAAIDNPTNERFFSAASIWELAIKVNVGKMEVPGGLAIFLADLMSELMLTPIHVRPEHTILIESLALHHKDPFDRLLVAQCLFEGMSIVSIDAKLDAYGVTRIW